MGSAELMAKQRPRHYLPECGAVYNRWQGKCDACGEWNSLAEEDTTGAPRWQPRATRPKRKGRTFALETLKGETKDAPRITSGIGELDRVTGGGFVRGSVLLIGGDPGIGKSTLLMQATAALALAGHRVVYVSGEEAVAQVRLRAERMGLADAPVDLASETNVEDIIATLSRRHAAALVVIDSIQTMWTDTVESAPGTVTQVRGSAQALIRFAKTSGACHHPGRPCHQGRPDRRAPRGRAYGRCRALLRGRRRASVPHPARGEEPLRPTDEIGVFEMTGPGPARGLQPLRAVPADRDLGSPGTAVFAGMEGTRPVLVEIQALVAPTSLGTPRRAVVGWDSSPCPWCWPCWRPMAGSSWSARRLSQRRRRPAHQRARRRSGRGRSWSHR
jgi:DNA repair protein RadA/Sms